MLRIALVGRFRTTTGMACTDAARRNATEDFGRAGQDQDLPPRRS
jgi:hypothetical protein